eukprot:scaffold114900_cov72-Phaeocystis_antarctica.AAC.3
MAATANATAHWHSHSHNRKRNHALPSSKQARLKPDTFFADGSRIRLIEPMTPEREATLAWCKVAGLGGTNWPRRALRSALGPVACGLPSQLPLATHSQLPFATQAGMEEEVRHNRGLGPARSTRANPPGRPRLCAPRYMPVESRV